MTKKPFFITGTLIGLIIAFQYTSDPLVLFDDKLEQEKDFDRIILMLEQEKILISEKLESLQAKVSLLSKTKAINTEEFNILELEAGRKEVSWEWYNLSISWDVTASDLRDLINVLSEPHVQAVAVWSQRVIYSTPIIDIKDVILVWNSRFTSPIIVHVIWDTDVIRARLSVSPILTKLWKKHDEGKVEIVESETKNITIPKI